MANPRYYELKYEGEIYTKKYEIDEILLENDLNWFFDCEVENLRIEIQKETLIINSGIYYNGIFEYGVIRDVDWRSGKLLNGVIYNGTFKNIVVERGIIFNGIFLSGEILKGDIRGGDLRNMRISNQAKQGDDNGQDDENSEDDTLQTHPQMQQVQSQGQMQQVQTQGQTQGQNIQNQVQGQVQQPQGQNIQNQTQKTQENIMKKNLLKFDLFVEKHINEDLESKISYTEDETVQDTQNNDTDKIESEIDNIMSKLENFEPEEIIFEDYVIDSQIENKGIIKASVWIEFIGISDPDQYDFDRLEEEFIQETDFDEVEILSSDDSITYSVNVYDYE